MRKVDTFTNRDLIEIFFLKTGETGITNGDPKGEPLKRSGNKKPRFHGAFLFCGETGLFPLSPFYLILIRFLTFFIPKRNNLCNTVERMVYEIPACMIKPQLQENNKLTDMTNTYILIKRFTCTTIDEQLH